MAIDVQYNNLQFYERSGYEGVTVTCYRTCTMVQNRPLANLERFIITLIHKGPRGCSPVSNILHAHAP